MQDQTISQITKALQDMRTGRPELVNQANVVVNRFLNQKGKINVKLLAKFLNTREDDVKYYGLKVMDFRITRYWNTQIFDNDHRKLYISCLMAFLTQAKVHVRVLDCASHVFFKALYREWPERNSGLLNQVFKALLSANRVLPVLFILKYLIHDLTDQYSLDTNLARKKKIIGFMKDSKILNYIEGILKKNFDNNVHAKQTIEVVLEVLNLLKENEISKYVPILFKTFNDNQLRDISGQCLLKMSTRLGNNTNLFLEQLSKIVNPASNPHDRQFFVHAMVNIVKKQEPFLKKVNKKMYFAFLMKLLSLRNYPYELRKTLMRTTNFFLKAFNEDPQMTVKHFDLFSVYTNLLAHNIVPPPVFNKSQPITSEENREILSNQKTKIGHLRDLFRPAFTIISMKQGVREKILISVLTQMFNFEKFSSQQHFSIVSRVFEWCHEDIPRKFRDPHIAKFNDLLKKWVAAFLSQANSTSKNNDLNKRCILLLKRFDVCFEHDQKSLYFVSKSLVTFGGATSPGIRAVVLSEWKKICKLYPHIIKKNFKGYYDLSNIIQGEGGKNNYRSQDLLEFYEGMIIVSEKGAKAISVGDNTEELAKDHINFMSFLLKNPVNKFCSEPKIAQYCKSPVELLKGIFAAFSNQNQSGINFELFFLLKLFSRFCVHVKTVSLAPYLTKILPQLFTLLKTVHSIYVPENLAKIPKELAKIVIHCAETEDLISRKNFFDMKKNAYSIIGFCCLKVHVFWTNSNLVNVLGTCLFQNMKNSCFPYRNISRIVKEFLIPFIRGCPSNKYNQFLLSVVGNFLQIVSIRISEKKPFVNPGSSEKSNKEEVLWNKEKQKLFKRLGILFNYFGNNDGGMDTHVVKFDHSGQSMDLFSFLTRYDKIFLLIVQISLKFMSHGQTKYFYLYDEFFRTIIEIYARNPKFEKVMAFYLMKGLLFTVTNSKDLHTNQKIVTLISRIFLAYKNSNGSSKYINYMFVKIGGDVKYANLLKNTSNRMMKFKKKNKHVRSFLQHYSGKNAMKLTFSLQELNESGIDVLEKVF